LLGLPLIISGGGTPANKILEFNKAHKEEIKREDTAFKMREKRNQMRRTT